MRDVVRGEILEAVVPIAQVDIVRIRLRALLVVPALELIQGVRGGQVQRAQDEGVQHAEDDGVGADAERQGEYSGDRESRRFTEYPEAVAHVLHDRVDERNPGRLARLLFEPQVAAEFDSRLAFGRGAVHAAALQVVRAQLDVRAKFFVDVVLDARAENGTHISSGLAASAAAIASASRFQSLVSSRSRLRPGVVNS